MAPTGPVLITARTPAVAAPAIAITAKRTLNCRMTTPATGSRPDSSRSHRPASSPPRVIRVAANKPQTPRSTARTVPVRQTANPPASPRSTGSPNSVRIAGFRASASRAAGSSPLLPAPRYVATTTDDMPAVTATTTKAPSWIWRSAREVVAHPGAASVGAGRTSVGRASSMVLTEPAARSSRGRSPPASALVPRWWLLLRSPVPAAPALVLLTK